LTIASINNNAIKIWDTINVDRYAFIHEGKDIRCTHLKKTGVYTSGWCYIGCFTAECSLAREKYEGDASQTYYGQRKGVLQDETMCENGIKLFYIQGVKGFAAHIKSHWV
jgi:hypothetical protein